jgi:redox-sensing transcriptional repressor
METPERNDLSQMLTFLRILKLRGRTYVNSQTLAENMRLTDETIQALLAEVGLGIPGKREFEIGQSVDVLESFLGYHNLKEAFIAGAGKMGSMLINSADFRNCGLKITAAFDIDPSIIGTEINSVKIVNIEKLPGLVHRMHIALGIITTPPNQAQVTANIMTSAKIQVIWNFTPEDIKVTSGIILENTAPGADLKQVFNSISERYKKMQPWTNNVK